MKNSIDEYCNLDFFYQRHFVLYIFFKSIWRLLFMVYKQLQDNICMEYNGACISQKGTYTSLCGEFFFYKKKEW